MWLPTAVNRQSPGSGGRAGSAAVRSRIHNRLRLTPLGEMVLTHVRSTLRECTALRAHCRPQGMRRGEITVAATSGPGGLLAAIAGA